MNTKSCLAIGNFDGVHLGHQKLIEKIVAYKREHSTSLPLKTVVLTFEPHPVEILKPGIRVPRLCSGETKEKLIKSYGVEDVIVVPFTKTFSETGATEFLDTVVKDRLDCAFITMGKDFHFGANREGNPNFLKKWCSDNKIDVEIAEPVMNSGEIISSSMIRQRVMEGNVNAAKRMLGRPFSFTAPVVHGDKRGRQLGFPTANLIPHQENHSEYLCLPGNGVYITETFLDESRSFPSITNVGIKPTVSQSGIKVIESHLLNFNEDIYGKTICVHFIDRIRSEMKFNSLQELKNQIEIDTQKAKTFWGLT